MVTEGNRLRRLQMREARHHACRMGKRLLGERQLQRAQLLIQRINGIANPEAEIERDLVVARARRVKPPRHRADQLGEARFDIHMNIFERPRKFERTRLDFAGDFV